jgi:hypothetical protein
MWMHVCTAVCVDGQVWMLFCQWLVDPAAVCRLRCVSKRLHGVVCLPSAWKSAELTFSMIRFRAFLREVIRRVPLLRNLNMCVLTKEASLKNERVFLSGYWQRNEVMTLVRRNLPYLQRVRLTAWHAGKEGSMDVWPCAINRANSLSSIRRVCAPYLESVDGVDTIVFVKPKGSATECLCGEDVCDMPGHFIPEVHDEECDTECDEEPPPSKRCKHGEHAKGKAVNGRAVWICMGDGNEGAD